MSFYLADAKKVLRLDGTDNDELVESLIETAEDYVEQATGLTADQQRGEALADTAKGFLVTLWYFGDHSDDAKMQRLINHLLRSLTAKITYKGPSV